MVCALAGYGPGTLAKRIAAGRMPKHVDRGRDGLIFLREEVLAALGLLRAAEVALRPDHDPWDFEPGEINRHLAEEKERIRRVARGNR